MKHFQVHNDTNKPPKTTGASARPSICRYLLHNGVPETGAVETTDGVTKMRWRLSLKAARRGSIFSEITYDRVSSEDGSNYSSSCRSLARVVTPEMSKASIHEVTFSMRMKSNDM